ncbi:MAG TPA: hypothetical protein VFQ92_08550 [Blastocatellia bacterium]|nr:hypothetical protein [Blastocatellia bacterium]
MLMIIEQHSSDMLLFKLAGTLAGDWVTEFKRCWMSVKRSSNVSRAIVDLTEVTFVDETGKELLGMMMKEGAELITRDVLMKSIVEEIAQETSML